MSDPSSDSGSEIDSFSSYTTTEAPDSEYEIEDEIEETCGDGDTLTARQGGESSRLFTHGVDRDRIEAYRDEPIATPEWLENYRDQKQEIDNQMANQKNDLTK